MLTTLPLRAPRRRIASLLVTTSLLFGLLLVSAPGVDAGRGGCKVTNEGPGPNAGKTYATLTRAISTATSGDTLSIIETCWGSFTIDKNLDLVGTTPEATLQGKGRGRVLEITGNAMVTLTNLWVTGGNAAFGGGIYNAGTLTMTDSGAFENTAESGGGILNSGTLILLTGSFVNYNIVTTGDGAGIYNDGGDVTLSADSEIWFNYTDSGNGGGDRGGGGIYNYLGTVTLSDSVSVGGNDSADGGGIYNNAGTVTLNGSAQVGDETQASYNNTAFRGGGIYNYGGTVNLNGSSSVRGNKTFTFGSPVPEGSGGGIFLDGGTVNLNDSSSVRGNTAQGLGGGIYIASGTINPNCNAVTANTTDNCYYQ